MKSFNSNPDKEKGPRKGVRPLREPSENITSNLLFLLRCCF